MHLGVAARYARKVIEVGQFVQICLKKNEILVSSEVAKVRGGEN